MAKKIRSKSAGGINLHELIYPVFVKEKGLKEKVVSIPGVYKHSLSSLVREIGVLKKLGIRNILLFGIPKKKDYKGGAAYQKNNVVSEAVKIIKDNFSDILIITDVCLCAYTTHGHCGVIEKGQKKINKQKTLKALSETALLQARAGADLVAPSAMAQGQVKAIRDILDKKGFKNTKVMGYSAKFASNFYGPFRNIVDSAPKFGDRRGYQLDCSESKTALDRIKQDIKEGADIVMVKPALGYLDIVRAAKSKFNQPLAVYNVSGEYLAVKLGSKKGFWNEQKMVFEIIRSIKRSGADFIITYHAKDIAEWQKKK